MRLWAILVTLTLTAPLVTAAPRGVLGKTCRIDFTSTLVLARSCANSIHESQPILPWKNSLARESEEKSISSLQWISNSQRVFALVFTALRTVADARCFSHFVFAPRCADLRRFAAKISQTIEKAVKSLPIARGRVEMYQLG